MKTIRPNNKLVHLDKNILLAEVASGMTITKIAKKYDVSRTSIYNKLNQYGYRANRISTQIDAKKQSGSGEWMVPIRLSEKLLASYEVVRAPVDVLDIALKEGLDIAFETLNQRTSGMYMDKKIVINKTLPKTRLRFTIAHELAHHVLKHKLTLMVPARMRMNESPSDKDEAEANRFAASLLMPYSFLKKDIDDFKDFDEDDIQTLAEIYQVSQIAMTIRLQQTKLFET
jgi:Zn-dependent peptidase ImmA (M78 family)